MKLECFAYNIRNRTDAREIITEIKSGNCKIKRNHIEVNKSKCIYSLNTTIMKNYGLKITNNKIQILYGYYIELIAGSLKSYFEDVNNPSAEELTLLDLDYGLDTFDAYEANKDFLNSSYFTLSPPKNVGY